MDGADALTLRPARLPEARALADMSRRLIEQGLDWRYTPSRMAVLLSDPETLAVVACDARHIQGFAVMQFGAERAHLVLLCVEPAQQRRFVFGAEKRDQHFGECRFHIASQIERQLLRTF